MITQRRLLHLLTLVEYGHFGRAAEALNISQPALSKSIQALEAELDVPLVDRKSGGVCLTVFGQVLAERSKPLLTVEDDLRREIKLLNEHQIGALSVAFGPYPSITCGYAGAARLLANSQSPRRTACTAPPSRVTWWWRWCKARCRSTRSITVQAFRKPSAQRLGRRTSAVQAARVLRGRGLVWRWCGR